MLVIDDRDTNRDIVTNYLEGCSAKVTAVSSTAAAWPMLVAADAIGKPFHAAIVDMIMPDENGLEFATRIKAHPALSRLKVIIATSIDWQGDVAAIREAGIEGVLTKPIRRNDLIDAAARAVSGTRHAGWRPTPTGNGKSCAQDIAESQQKRLKARILLAEDNPVNVEVAKEYLTSFGCTVQVASNGLEALAAVKLAPFDIILMDCQMAVMDGLTATRRIRGYEKESHAQPTPVIALTANAFAEDKARCLSSGMNDYLSKPYSERQLYSVVTKWLSDPAQNIDAAETCIGNDTNETGALADLTSATCCLDEAALAPMRSSRPELLARIIATFLDHAPTLLNDLRSAADEGDGERMSRHAHSLKSSSANLGAMALSAHCRELEKTAKTNDLETSRELARQIFADFEVVKIALNTEMVALTVPAKILKEVG